MADFKHFVDASWLAAHLHDDDLFVIDCSFDLFDPAAHGKGEYAREHIEGAFYLDMDEDLSRDGGGHGGRRMLPDAQALGAKLAGWGMTMDSPVVCYDGGVYSAPRAWWQLTYMGYRNVFVLDGGLAQWKRAGYPTTSEVPKPKGTGAFEAHFDASMYADVERVRAAAFDPRAILVDSRAHNRYTGEYEPLYRKSGHIPTAINVPYLENMKGGQDPSLIGDPIQWERNFAHCMNAKDVIFYCGSGIEASINYMFFAELGKSARLYVGSMSDWVTYDELDVESSR